MAQPVPKKKDSALRIVSLLPSATEIVCVLGARDQLVGVSHECDHPPGVDQLPVLTRPRFTLPERSDEIDRVVRKTLEDALAVYEVDVDLLRELEPDVVVTQSLCDVCAVSLDDVRRALHELARDDIEIVSLEPRRLGDVWRDILTVGDALGRRGADVVAEIEQRCAAIARRTTSISERPTVLTIEWLDPIMVGGTWMPELVRLAGGEPLVTQPGEHAPTLSAEELVELDPDVVLVKPCGFDLARTRQEIELLEHKLPSHWRASRLHRVYVADGNAYFNRPGPRLVESLEILAACVHPELFTDFEEKHAASYFQYSTA
ncbi:MAG: cobalamin-binding protein [Acidobacteriota bacterium]